MKRRLVLLGTLLVLMATAAVAEDRPPLPNLTLISNVNVFDGRESALRRNMHVLVKDNLIETVSAEPLAVVQTGNVAMIDGGGRTLMPGLIDNHWHAMFAGATMAAIVSRQDGYINLLAAREAKATLLRGFTTVRDLGGNSFSLKAAIDEGLYPGPRIYPSGQMVGQTSGHSDLRPLIDHPLQPASPLIPAARSGHLVVADGVPQVLMRVREALKMGATQIKVMAGGGTASPWDPIDVSQYTFDELKAAVDAAAAWNTYVAVHAYSPAAVRTAIEAGVRVIEHGNLIDDETARLMKEKDVWLSIQPFLLSEEWMRFDDPVSRAKQEVVFRGTETSMKLALKHGVKVAWGTDIIFTPAMTARQGYMLTLMRKWYAPSEVLKLATSNAAELLRLSGPRNPYPDAALGVIEEGAYADLILVDGNPLEDLDLIADPHSNFVLIMKDGVVHKNTLNP